MQKMDEKIRNSTAVTNVIDHSKTAEKYEEAADTCMFKHNYAQAQKLYKMALKLCAANDSAQISYNMCLGIVCYRLEKFDEAISYYNKALNLLEVFPKKYYLKNEIVSSILKIYSETNFVETEPSQRFLENIVHDYNYSTVDDDIICFANAIKLLEKIYKSQFRFSEAFAVNKRLNEIRSKHFSLPI